MAQNESQKKNDCEDLPATSQKEVEKNADKLGARKINLKRFLVFLGTIFLATMLIVVTAIACIITDNAQNESQWVKEREVSREVFEAKIAENGNGMRTPDLDSKEKVQYFLVATGLYDVRVQTYPQELEGYRIRILKNYISGTENDVFVFQLYAESALGTPLNDSDGALAVGFKYGAREILRRMSPGNIVVPDVYTVSMFYEGHRYRIVATSATGEDFRDKEQISFLRTKCRGIFDALIQTEEGEP